jgi:hypothetical protein
VTSPLQIYVKVTRLVPLLCFAYVDTIKHILFCSLRFGFALHCFLIFFVRISLSGYFFFIMLFRSYLTSLVSLPQSFRFFLSDHYFLFSIFPYMQPSCFPFHSLPALLLLAFLVSTPRPLAFVVMTFACLVRPFSSASCAFPSGWQHE